MIKKIILVCPPMVNAVYSFCAMNRKRNYLQSKIFIILLLLAILGFHGLNNYHILTQSRYCFGPGAGDYFKQTFEIFETLKSIKFNSISLSNFYLTAFKGYSFKPPLFFLTSAPFFFFGIDKNVLITFSNLIYLAVLIFSTYGIGKIYSKSKIIGFFSAFLVSMFPSVFAMSRVFMIDLALAAMVALTFYLFMLNKFYSLKFSILAGLIIGMGLITKESYFIFVCLIPFIFFFRKENKTNKTVIKNIVFSCVLGCLIAANFYILTFDRWVYVFTTVRSYAKTSFWYFGDSLLRYQLLPVFFLLFLFSLIFLFFKKSYSFIFIIIVPLIILTLAPCKLSRYTLPIFPFIAVSICSFIHSFTRFRTLFYTILVLFSFFQYYLISYSSLVPLSGHFSNTFSEDQGLFRIRNERDYEAPALKIIEIISKIKVKKDIKVLTIGGSWKMVNTIYYLGLKNNLKLNCFPLDDMDPEIDLNYRYRYGKDFEDCYKNLPFYDLVVIGQNDFSDAEEYFKLGIKIFQKNRKNFFLKGSIVFPDRVVYQVYKNKLI